MTCSKPALIALVAAACGCAAPTGATPAVATSERAAAPFPSANRPPKEDDQGRLSLGLRDQVPKPEGVEMTSR
jgi:hypothetical protein